MSLVAGISHVVGLQLSVIVFLLVFVVGILVVGGSHPFALSFVVGSAC